MIPSLRRIRGRLRQQFFRMLRHVAELDDAQYILSNALARFNLITVPPELADARSVELPYKELRRSVIEPTPNWSDVIFITGRFRSGSTLLWNLFRHIPGCTAYYEPFNERRWFDTRSRGERVDPTHLGVTDYWSEYSGLQELGKYFREQWKETRLYMPGHAWDPAMQRYLEIMIERSAGRPVIQFNEVDFRLAWLRARFRGARILHIFRHPRDQWCSTLPSNLPNMSSLTLTEFKPLDRFYLLPWAADLMNYFPFLTLEESVHPYAVFYAVWKLSYLFGRFHADLSVALENLVAEPRTALIGILRALAIEDYNLDALTALVKPISQGKWREQADDAWFARVESGVDETLQHYAGQLAPASRME
jgi:hypothetical protein